MNPLIKLIITSLIIVAISEISKKNAILGAILASLPIVSFLGIIWLYIDTKDIKKISALSQNIFWMVIPSLSFFIIFPIMLKHKINFHVSMGSSALIMTCIYFIMFYILKKFGIQ